MNTENNFSNLNMSNTDVTTSIWLGLRPEPNNVLLTDPFPNYPSAAVKKLQKKIDDYKVQEGFVDDKYLLVCCQEAMIAIKEGNFGIGNCLVDTDGSLTGEPGKILLQGHNELMYPYYRSDRHGEMVILDDFEQKLANGYWGKKYKSSDPLPTGITLYTQLESCVMCLARIANSGIARCLYGAPDNGGGMVHLLCNLPPTYTALVNRQYHNAANISKELVQICMECFSVTGSQVGQQLMKRAGQKPANYKYCDPMFFDGVRSRMYADPTGFYRDPGNSPGNSPPGPPPGPTPGPTHGLTTPAIIGISVASTLVLVGIILLIIYFVNKKRKKRGRVHPK